MGRYDRRRRPPAAAKGDDDMRERVIETDLSWYRFMTNPYPRRPADWEGEEDDKAALAKMLSRVPKRAYPLGVFGQTIADRPCFSWTTDDRFFLLRLRGRKHEWAMFRISWDDNEGRYEWQTGVVGSGFASPKEAAEAMLRALYASGASMWTSPSTRSSGTSWSRSCGWSWCRLGTRGGSQGRQRGRCEDEHLLTAIQRLKTPPLPPDCPEGGGDATPCAADVYNQSLRLFQRNRRLSG